MSSSRWQTLSSLTQRQIISILLLFMMIVGFLPFPHTSARRSNSKDVSRPFPCQHRACGCQSAEQCRRQCCCFSTTQKLAWARRHRVNTTEVVAKTSQDVGRFSRSRKGCCSNRENPLTERTIQRTGIAHIIGVVAQECHGIAKSFSGQAVFVIPSQMLLTPIMAPVDERLELRSTRFQKRDPEPPIPPPRLCRTWILPVLVTNAVDSRAI